jgi:hypothetical protein
MGNMSEEFIALEDHLIKMHPTERPAQCLIIADYLEAVGDSLADGWRALGINGRHPTVGTNFNIRVSEDNHILATTRNASPQWLIRQVTETPKGYVWTNLPTYISYKVLKRGRGMYTKDRRWMAEASVLSDAWYLEIDTAYQHPLIETVLPAFHEAARAFCRLDENDQLHAMDFFVRMKRDGSQG